MIKESDAFFQKGISSYKSQQDFEAIGNYESAIKSYPTAEIYYHYGNSFANLNRLEESIKAYKISLLLKPKRPDFVSYNIACSYSRLGKIEEAYSHLANSIDLGYNTFYHIEKDPGMENLREQPDWKEKINELIRSNTYEEQDLYGVLLLYQPKILTKYYLCRNKEIIAAFQNYPGCEMFRSNGYARSKWELKNREIIIAVNSICDDDLISDPDALENKKIKYCIGYRKKSVFKECKNKIYSSKIKKYELQQAYEENFQKLSPEQEPKQCDPNFVPKTLEDLYVK